VITIQGKGVSSGIGMGPLYFFRRAKTEINHYIVEDAAAEWLRFKGAQSIAVDQLGELAEKARAEAGDEAAMLFETHQMMAEDLDYEEAIQALIQEENHNAEWAVSDVAEQFAEMFAMMDDSYMQARAADVKDVSQRILGILCGVVQGGIDSDVPVLLASDDLAPSETIQLDKSKILGFITAHGSGSSHTAILARTMGIPAIVGLGNALDPSYEGRLVVVDGSTGAVIVDPSDEVFADFVQKREAQLQRQALLATLKGEQNITRDGKTIRVYCNIGSPEDVAAVLANDGGGIGLFRSEFLYLNAADYPTEEDQFEAYKAVLSGMGGKEVIIRTCDIGADKQIDYFQLPVEENPALGMRALRISLTRPGFFRTQLRALYRASVYGKLGIMFPMVTSVW
jgi:phosphotransferase system enzyme I (PtsI)